MDKPAETESTPQEKRFSWRNLLSVRAFNYLLLLMLAILIIKWPSALPNRLHYWRTGAVEIDGLTIYLDPDDWFATRIILNPGEYEPAETKAIRERVKPGDTFVDVGASIGWYTVIASKLVGENGRVIAFEPEPYAFSLLKRNVEANGCDNVVLVQKALSNEPGTLTLFVAEAYRGQHSVVLKDVSDVSIEVEAIRLDDYLEEHGLTPDFVKIDVEGAEGMVLDGMSETLRSKDRLSLMIEYAPDRLRQSGYDGEKLLRSFADSGFKVFFVNEESDQLQPSNPQDITARVARDRRYTNLFLYRDGAGSPAGQ